MNARVHATGVRASQQADSLRGNRAASA